MPLSLQHNLCVKVATTYCIPNISTPHEYPIPILLTAGMIVSDEVQRYAERQGFFVLKPNGRNVTLTNTPTFKPKEWRPA